MDKKSIPGWDRPFHKVGGVMQPRSSISPRLWHCDCGAKNSGSVCKECGQPEPWYCDVCKSTARGKTCGCCGAKKPR